MTRAPSASSGSPPGVPLQAVIEAPRRLDELSTARVIGEAADAVHKAQKGGQPLGTLMPQAIVVAPSGISLAPPATPSIAYSAPERLRGQGGDRRSDVFSLGVVLWEALAHERLFDAATDDDRKEAVLERPILAPSELNANVPAELDAICKKALDRDPANRYQSAKVMAAEISAVLDDAGYPDSNDQIASYLASAFPTGSPVAPLTMGAALAAKLAAAPTTTSAPATRQQLGMTMHGMAPIREPAAAAPEPVKPEPAPPTLSAPKIDPGKTMTVGSGLSLPELAKPAVDAKPQPQSVLSPAAFSSKPSVLTEAPAPREAVSTQPGTGIPTLPPGDDYTALAKPKAMIVDEPKAKATIVDKPKAKATIVDEPKAKATIIDEPKPKASISSAETVATPALVSAPAATPALAVPPALAPTPAPTPASAAAPALAATPALTPTVGAGIAGLPAMPPGATRSHDDNVAASAGAKPYPEVAVEQVTAPSAPAPAVAASVQLRADPSAAVSLPRPRSPSQSGTDRNSTHDVLADWGWKTDSQAAIYDGDQDQYEEAPNAGRKRLILAIGGALGAILLIVVIVAIAGGGGDKKKDKAAEAPIADTSRTAESANAKLADPVPAPVPADPTAPAGSATAAQPPSDPVKVEPAPVEPAPVEPTAVDTAKVEAAKIEAAKIEAAKVEAAKVDLAKTDAANQKLVKAEAAKAETARIETEKADAAAAKAAKNEAARLAKLEAANTAAAKAADAARIKAEKAEAARIAKAAKLEADRTKPVETAKVKPPKEPKKKEPKIAKVTGELADPYAEKSPKVDPAIAYKTGFQQYVRGDTSGALSTFKSSLAANPGYAPTWRGLGLAYEKMGQKAQAKKSFIRYLQMSPKASDAEQIRGRLERLGS